MMFYIMLALFLVAPGPYGQRRDPFEPTLGGLLVDNVADALSSAAEYSQARGEHKAELQRLEREFADCKARSCSNLAALESQLAAARADDQAIRSMERGILQSLGINGYTDFEDLFTKGAKEVQEQRRLQYMAWYVYSPVAAWCNAGYKAEDIVPAAAGKSVSSPKDCVWDILRGWAAPAGIVLTPNSQQVLTFYELMWKRDISARAKCEEQLFPAPKNGFAGLDALNAKTYVERQERILSCSTSTSELAKLKQEFKEREVLRKQREVAERERVAEREAAEKQREAAETAARRAEACNHYNEIRAQLDASNNDLRNLRTRMNQASQEYRRELIRARTKTAEATVLMRQKQADLKESLGINALEQRIAGLIGDRNSASVGCSK